MCLARRLGCVCAEPDSDRRWRLAGLPRAQLQDYRGLSAITQRSVEPLPHVDQVVDETRGAHFFTKLDLAMACMQIRMRKEDQYKTSFRVRVPPLACTVCRC